MWKAGKPMERKPGRLESQKAIVVLVIIQVHLPDLIISKIRRPEILFGNYVVSA